MTAHIGFTGTQKGMTEAQIKRVGHLLVLHSGVVHHGDCTGADAQCHDLALMTGHAVEIHPPTNERARAWKKGAAHMHPAKPYLVRNHDIVDAVQMLIATPKTATEELRSGTWATVRYARTQARRTR